MTVRLFLLISFRSLLDDENCLKVPNCSIPVYLPGRRKKAWQLRGHTLGRLTVKSLLSPTSGHRNKSLTSSAGSATDLRGMQQESKGSVRKMRGILHQVACGFPSFLFRLATSPRAAERGRPPTLLASTHNIPRRAVLIPLQFANRNSYSCPLPNTERRPDFRLANNLPRGVSLNRCG